MIREIKLMIKKKKILNDKGHFRFYSPFGKGTKPPVLFLDQMGFKTEQDLTYFLYDNYGEGEYLIIAFAKGRRGFWLFWRGEVNSEGFIFHQKLYNRKILKEWNKELEMSEDEQEMQDTMELKEEAVKEAKEHNKKRRYGFSPFLKPSSRRGEFKFWRDDSFSNNLVDNNPENNSSWISESENKSNLPKWEQPKDVELEKW